MSVVQRVPLRRVRFAGRLPRLAFTTLVVVLCLVGLRALVAPRSQPVIAAPQVTATVDPAVTGFAEAFARWFLGPHATRDQEQALAERRFGLPADGLGPVVGDQDAAPIRWSGVVAVAGRSQTEWAVTVAVDVGDAVTYLAVAVGREPSGRLFVARPPAVVGAPLVAARRTARAEPEVEDPAIRTVGERVVRHYLAGEAVDLDADLDPGTSVSLPATTLRLREVLVVTWVVPQRRVALTVLARSRGGQQQTLRYELDVVRHGRRWLVRRVHVNPMALEAVR